MMLSIALIDMVCSDYLCQKFCLFSQHNNISWPPHLFPVPCRNVIVSEAVKWKWWLYIGGRIFFKKFFFFFASPLIPVQKSWCFMFCPRGFALNIWNYLLGLSEIKENTLVISPHVLSCLLGMHEWMCWIQFLENDWRSSIR